MAYCSFHVVHNTIPALNVDLQKFSSRTNMYVTTRMITKVISDTTTKYFFLAERGTYS